MFDIVLSDIIIDIIQHMEDIEHDREPDSKEAREALEDRGESHGLNLGIRANSSRLRGAKTPKRRSF